MQSKREFIRLHWHNVVCSLVDRLFSAEKWRVEIVGTDRRIIWATTTDTESAAWDAAHAYTLEHQEAVRQLKSQVQFAAEDIWNEASWKDFFDFMDFLDDDSLLEQISIAVRRQCAYVRTLAMLESALADKLRGTREAQ